MGEGVQRQPEAMIDADPLRQQATQIARLVQSGAHLRAVDSLAADGNRVVGGSYDGGYNRLGQALARLRGEKWEESVSDATAACCCMGGSYRQRLSPSPICVWCQPYFQP